MSKDIYHMMSLYYTLDGDPLHIEVEDGEYKDMLKEIRNTTPASKCWLKTRDGHFINMDKVAFFTDKLIDN